MCPPQCLAHGRLALSRYLLLNKVWEQLLNELIVNVVGFYQVQTPVHFLTPSLQAWLLHCFSIAPHRCCVFFTNGKRPSTSNKITTRFNAVLTLLWESGTGPMMSPRSPCINLTEQALFGATKILKDLILKVIELQRFSFSSRSVI